MRSFSVLIFASFVAMSLQCGAGPKVASRPIASCPTPPPNVKLCPAGLDANRAGCPGGPGGINGTGGVPIPPNFQLATYCAAAVNPANPGCPGTSGGLMGPPICRDGKLPVNNICAPAPPTCPSTPPAAPALALAGCPGGFGGYGGLGGPATAMACVNAAIIPATEGCPGGPGGMMGPGGPNGPPLAAL